MYDSEEKNEIVLVDNIDFNGKRKRNKNRKYRAIRNVGILSLVGVLSFGSLGYGIGLGIGHTQSKSATSNDSNADFVSTSLVSNDREKDSYSDVIDSVSNSVVSINVTSTSTDYFGRTREYESAGSGFIFSEDDDYVYIATNNHVIDGASSVYISVNDDAQAPANYIGSDSVSDLAVISASKQDLADLGIEYDVAVFGNSKDLEIGDTAIAIGNALGMGKSATKGIISALNKDLDINNSHLTVLQTDAAINPGNSGGPLINSKGEVIGINTAKISSEEAEGVGYSIPSDIAQPILYNLLEQGKTKETEDANNAYLGIEGFTITSNIKDAYGLPSTGVYISNIIKGSGAAKSGIRPGDIIIEVNSEKVSSMKDLSNILDEFNINDTVSVSIIRNNKVGTTDVTLGALNTGF